MVNQLTHDTIDPVHRPTSGAVTQFNWTKKHVAICWL